MGVVLDSSPLVAAERAGRTLEDLLLKLEARVGFPETVVSVISVAELQHGVARATSAAMCQRRQQWID